MDANESHLNLPERIHEPVMPFVYLGMKFPCGSGDKGELLKWPHGNNYSRKIEVAPAKHRFKSCAKEGNVCGVCGKPFYKCIVENYEK